VKGWITGVGTRTAFIEPGSPWENGYVESFNGKLRDELPNAEAFNTLTSAQDPDRTLATVPQHRPSAFLTALLQYYRLRRLRPTLLLPGWRF